MSVRHMELMEVRAKLEDLISEGKEVVITKRGVELARLTPMHPEAVKHSAPPASRIHIDDEDDKDGFDLLLDEAGDD